MTVPDTTPEAASQTIREDLQIESAALTDRGPVRATNQDAFIERAAVGLWAVADGMGGLSDGDVASRMVCDSLANAAIVASLDEQIEVVTGQLRQVNEYLRRAATRSVNPVQSGSTVVVLLIRENECAVLWAGDSRAYRLRDGVVSQLTTDHAWVSPDEGADAQAITRAVGGEDSLVLDVVRGDARPEDRFLLCSDGVGRVLDVGVLGEILRERAPGPGCAELIAQSITRGGTDNMTALIVDCGRAALPAALDHA